MPTTKTLMVLPTDSESTTDLADYLNFEESRDREIVDFGLAQGASSKFNVADYVVTSTVRDRPSIAVFKIDPQNPEAELRQFLATHTAIAYTPALIGGVEQDILITRAGATLKLGGKMSTFGGPDDKGMSETEGLALIQPAHFAQFQEYFRIGATLPRGRDLNPKTLYIAARWDRNVTPYSWLRRIKVLVRNPVSGASAQAQPIDWGPAAWTGRIADLSPGLAEALKLKTDDTCEIVIPLPQQTATNPAAAASRSGNHAGLVAIANRQFTLFHGVDENNEPLRSQIEKYWVETGQSFPSNGVEEPWSAVFISWCVKQAGATAADFKFHPKHAVYIKEAITKAKAGSGTFRAFPIEKYAPKTGDLIHANRENGTITYAQAGTQTAYPSHTAIVVGFGDGSSGKFALTVGGNEGDSVRNAEVPLDGNGFVKPRARNPFISVVRTFDGGANPA